MRLTFPTSLSATRVSALGIFFALLFFPGTIFLRAGAAGAQGQVRLPARQGVAELEARQQRKEGNVFIADGDVDLRYQDVRIRADHMEYNAETAEAMARGHVQFDFDNQHLDADEARYNVHSKRGTFARVRGTVKIDRRPNPAVLITDNPLYFEAEEVERVDERTYVIRKVWLTVCEPERPVWKFYAPRATLRLNEKIALVNANFRVL